MRIINAERVQVEVRGIELENRGEDKAAEQTLLDRLPAVSVAIGSLVVADSPRISGENLEHVQALTNALDKLPPIIVHRASMRVLDGVHRLRAARLSGQTEIEARFFDGDDADAFVVAVRSNTAHGLPLSLADRKAAAGRIIASHPQWSDRLIASVTGLAAGTIAEARRKSDDEAPRADIRVGLDGRHRPVDSAERRRIASKMLIDDPNLSLRQVARVARISPETARNVRARLRKGENSVPPGRGRLRRMDHEAPDEKRQGDAGHAVLVDANQVMRRLKSDPTLRFTESGRMLLRLLDLHAMSGEKWAELCDNVPAHCKTIIGAVALRCAEDWRRFGKRLVEQDKSNTA
jgi:ParB-like chromosome segregation protein Spo0J